MVNSSASLEALEAQKGRLEKDISAKRAEVTDLNWEIAGKQMEKEGHASPKPQAAMAPPPSPSSPKPGKPLWGSVVAGVRTVLTVAVVAVVAYAALNFGAGLMGFPDGTVYGLLEQGVNAVSGAASSAYTSISDWVSGASNWIGNTTGFWKSSALETFNTPHVAAFAGGVGVAGVATSAAQYANAHSHTGTHAVDPSSAVDPNSIIANMDEHQAVTAASKLQSQLAHDNSMQTKMALKNAVHTSTDLTHEMLESRHAQQVRSGASAAQRILEARNNAQTWAERVEASMPQGPRSLA